MALQAMTNMPVSVGGDFKTNLEYVFNQLTTRTVADEIILMSDQERQDLATIMTESAFGRNAICVATHVNSLQYSAIHVYLGHCEGLIKYSKDNVSQSLDC